MTLTGRIAYQWRGEVSTAELAALHATAFGSPEPTTADLRSRLDRHSLGWVTARDGGHLVGFVNVAWDGGEHAFILDTAVAPGSRGRGIGQRLVAVATDGARAAGCGWLHVDFEPHLRHFYLDRGGFRATEAGLIRL